MSITTDMAIQGARRWYSISKSTPQDLFPNCDLLTDCDHLACQDESWHGPHGLRLQLRQYTIRMPSRPRPSRFNDGQGSQGDLYPGARR
jgi:hypothetical protein